MKRQGGRRPVRTGASFSNGSGDCVIAFATREGTPLFDAVAEATEEAILNSLFRATTTRGRDGHVAPAVPLDTVR